MRATCVLTDPAADRQSKASIAEINALLMEQMPALAEHLAGEPSGRGRDAWRFGAKGSLAVEVRGPKRGAWHDHEAGQGGDPLGLIAHLLGLPMREARWWALDWLGGPAVPEALPRHPERPRRGADASRLGSDTVAFAQRLWRDGMPPAGTLAEFYLASRGLHLEPCLPLRFHPVCPRGRAEVLPAMLALMTDPMTGQPCGVHRTFLLADGGGKAPPGPSGEPPKMMAGHSGVIRLSPDEEVTAGLGIAEGIETALSVMQCFGWRPVWAAASAGAIARFPVLPGIEALTIFADLDGAGQRAADECASRWRAAGREARIVAPPAGDWNDAHRKAA